MIRNRILLTVSFMTIVVVANAQELTRLNKIEIPRRDRAREHDREIKRDLNHYFTTWLTDSEVISFGRDLEIRRIDTENSKVKWAKDWDFRVRDASVSRSKRRLAISTRSVGLTVFDCDSGAKVFSGTETWLAKATGLEDFSCRTVNFLPQDGRLIVTNSSARLGRNAFLFSEKLDKVEQTLDIGGLPMKITLSDDGSRFVSLTPPSLLAVRDIGKNVDVYLSGLRPERAQSPPSDRSIFLDAFHDGQDTVVYAKSGGWGNGMVGVLSLAKKETVSFDSLSSWICMDVDFRTQRIVVAGSSNITVFDFDGQVIAELKNATELVNDGIEFSPSGEKIMVYNLDAILVFGFKPRVSE